MTEFASGLTLIMCATVVIGTGVTIGTRYIDSMLGYKNFAGSSDAPLVLPAPSKPQEVAKADLM